MFFLWSKIFSTTVFSSLYWIINQGLTKDFFSGDQMKASLTNKTFLKSWTFKAYHIWRFCLVIKSHQYDCFLLTALNYQKRPNLKFFMRIKWQEVTSIKQAYYLEYSYQLYLEVLSGEQVTSFSNKTGFSSLSSTFKLVISGDSLLVIKSLSYNCILLTILNYETSLS